MVGVVIVSHNPKLSEEVIRFCQDMKKEDFKLINGGGIDKAECFGTSPEVIEKAVIEANQGDGVVVLCDLGSSILNARKAKKRIEGKVRVEIVDAPLVEGAIVAVSANHPKLKMEEFVEFIKEAKGFPKL
ncbi:dihydroxyacetone kinase phosphoryl donor subunit DhaM [Fusobacterium sp.]|uniref:dihydroxyacetone kinase phosphoryl donor subunit DhaM n=1 Tax=Fusobacterium sp. TaxID=68766 RepID=UPI00396CFE16